MVRSKEVPKKPKDPLLTPPSKPRGFSFRDDGGGGGFGGSLPRNRGGAAMSSPAPASVPNYMRATSSSGAKAGQRQLQRAGVAPSSPSASTPTRQRRPVRVVPRGKVLFPAPTSSPGMVRPTCSSTLKDAKFPGALDLAPGATDAEGPAAMRVCPYTYCSLNGHAHAPAVPLRSFLAKRRRLIKTQQSMKHKGVSAFRRSTATGQQRPEAKNAVCAGAVAKVAPPLVDEEALLGDFFVEVYTGPRVSSGTSCSDMSLDEMDATVRRMEFVVFDRCTDDDDNNNRGNDLGVHGDGDGDGEGTPEERLGVCRDSSSECSDADTSGNLVEELPWMRYECDSLDDDVSEEQGVIPEETEVLAQGQEGGEDEEDTSGRFDDEGEEGSDEEPKPEGAEIISDLPREIGIVAEEEGVRCRADTVYQQEDSTGEETPHPGDDEECLSEVAHKMKIAAEQACTVEVCEVQEEKVEDRSEKVSESEVAERLENVLEDLCREENSADLQAKDDENNMQSASAGQLEVAGKQEEGESEMEIAETVPEVTCKEDFSEQEATYYRAVSQGEISDSSATGSPDVEISNEPRNDTNFEQDVNTVEDAFEQLDITAENTASSTEDAQKGLEIATCKSVDASEESGITHEHSQDFNSVCVDAPVQMEPEITEHKLEDSSEKSSIPQDSSQNSKFAHVDNGAQIEVSADAPAQMGPEITECKLEESSEESGISSQDFNSVCVDAPAKMEQEITERQLEDSSEESSIPQESGQNSKSAYVDNAAQIEVSSDRPAQMGLEITECMLEESSEESGIPPESSQSDKSALFNNGAETEPEVTVCKLEDPSEEKSGVAQEIVHDDNNSAYLGEGAQMELGNVPSELEDTPESSIAHEIGEDENSAYVSDDAQNGSEITTCELDDASESVAVQEAGQDHSCADVSGGAQNESEITPSELVNASEGSDVTQEAGQDHSCADVSGGAQDESELTPSELVNASEGSDVTHKAGRDDSTADVNAGPKKEPETMACEPEHAQEGLDITQIGHGGDYSAGSLKDTKIMTRGTKDACEEVCITEEVNLSPVVQTPQHNCDLSATDGIGEPESLPAEDSTGEPQTLPEEDNDAKEFSVDDMCSVFSGMNLKGDVYVDPTESDISPRKRLIIAGRRRAPEEEEHMRGFNPRAPNFLPLELDPDSEKVDLKHQTAEDRKNAEEWMIDYALRRAVNNLGGRKKKVELLVQAFETVLPHDEDEKKNISPTRPVQACN
uniref:Uncharacterized protein n=1 Tax=Avena sativa TaxID=4498 RepID=A0ACD5TAF0_AVESA